jgi:PilZ domain
VFEEKRRTPRIPFVAVAELAEMESGTSLTGQVNELSSGGCYVQSHTTLALDTALTIKIFADGECFEAKAKVIYAHPNFGMGLVFQGLSLQSGNLLRQWLLKSTQK